MKYDIPILSDDHAEFCKQEAERRYNGKLIAEPVTGWLLVEEREGDETLLHSDAVLRALSNYKRDPDDFISTPPTIH